MSTGTKRAPKGMGRDIQIVREGDQIILPPGMTYAQAREWLRRKEEEEERSVAVHYELNCYPLDGAVAFQRALAKIYGWTQMVPTPGFFGDEPPVMLGVQISLDETIQVPWGRVQIPTIAGYLETSMSGGDPTTGNPKFILNGEVKQKHKPEIQRIYEETLYFVRSKSIYKAQAVRLNYDWTRTDKPRFDPFANAPKFIDLRGVNEEDLIFPADVMASVNNNLFSPIERPEVMRRYHIPLKRGVLLEGPYGTGKTMTANVTAKKATRSGWTFLYVDSVQDLVRALQFATQYAPAVIFAEDVDRVTSGQRTMTIDQILNSMDGVDTKGQDIILVLTTNNANAIHKAAIRPGRIDLIVPVREPDAEAAARLVKLYGRGLLSPSADLKKIGEALKGKIPAMIREVVERSKMATIARQAAEGRDDDKIDIAGQVTEADIVASTREMDAHYKLLNSEENKDRTNLEKFGDAVGVAVGTRIADVFNEAFPEGGDSRMPALAAPRK